MRVQEEQHRRNAYRPPAERGLYESCWGKFTNSAPLLLVPSISTSMPVQKLLEEWDVKHEACTFHISDKKKAGKTWLK